MPFLNKQHAVSVFFDIEKAYDTIVQEPRGFRVAGRVTNFLACHNICCNLLYMELDDWQAGSGGCVLGINKHVTSELTQISSEGNPSKPMAKCPGGPPE